MYSPRLILAVLLAAGVASSAPPADDPGKPAPSSDGNAVERTVRTIPGIRTLPPVLRTYEKVDSLIVTLPGSAPPEPLPVPVEIAASVPPTPPAPDPERPVLHRSQPVYPAEFAAESATFCQTQIGVWTQADAIALLGDPRGHRPSLDDDGAESGDIYAFSDPSSRYRELEMDFDRETGVLRTVFAYPWRMMWQECRKLWGARVSAANADKGRTFYSYLDRRLDVLVDPTGKVISFGLY